MSQETLNAAVLLLRSRALESYSIIKDTLARPTEEGDADKIAAHSIKLAQFEGGMITLQQYADALLAPEEAPEDGAASEDGDASAPVSQSDQAPPRAVTPEQSPTLRRSMEQEEVKKKRTRTRKKKAESDE